MTVICQTFMPKNKYTYTIVMILNELSQSDRVHNADRIRDCFKNTFLVFFLTLG